MLGSKKNNVPEESTGSIRKFCKDISNGTPEYLEYTDTKYGYEATHCHDNVRHYVKHHGGEVVYGWIIWCNTKFKLEAEHHAVWKSPSGKLYDITPRVDGEEKVLFLPDPGRPYDFESRFLWCNRHNGDPILRFAYQGQKTRKERAPYPHVHPYHAWIRDLPGNSDNALE